MMYNRAVTEINHRFETKKAEFESHETCLFCKSSKGDGLYTCKTHKRKALPWNLQISLPSIRSSVMQSDEILKGTAEEYLSEVPYATRQLIIKDAVTMYKSAVSNKLRGNIKHFELKCKTRFDRGIFWLRANALKISGGIISVCSKRLKHHKYLRLSKGSLAKLPSRNTRDCKILYDRGAYYIVLSVDNTSDTEFVKRKYVSLDPGIRTFQTCFDPTGTILEFGKADAAKLKRIYTCVDYLKCLASRAIHRVKKHIYRRVRKLNRSVFGIVSNLHNQCASFLSKNYEHILLPSFNTSGMLRSGKLHSSVNRLMSSLSFYKFKEKLAYLCAKHRSSLYIVDESYTSKLCGNCGKLNDVGSSKVYSCNCGTVLDRDVNGARNILLQYLCV